MRWALFDEIVRMSWDTLRGNKMRSALTVLGIVIGITSIVGMTSLIRGFDQSLRDSIKTIGSGHDLRRQVLGGQPGVRRELPGAAEAAEHDAGRRRRDRARRAVDRGRRRSSSAAAAGAARSASTTGNQKTKPLPIFGTTDNYPSLTQLAGRDRPVLHGRRRSSAGRNVVVLGQIAVHGAVPERRIRSARPSGSGSRSTKSSA